MEICTAASASLVRSDTIALRANITEETEAAQTFMILIEILFEWSNAICDFRCQIKWNGMRRIYNTNTVKWHSCSKVLCD